MKLYYSPGACSLAAHIMLHETGQSFEHVRVDLKAKKTEGGEDYRAINPKGYVPGLTLDDGALLTENIAVLSFIGDQAGLVPDGPLGRYRLLEMLAFVSTEIHKSFKPLFANGSEDEKARAKEAIAMRLDQIAGMMRGDYLLGDTLMPVDAYLFVMLLWAGKNHIDVPDRLAQFRERMLARDVVRTAMAHEGLN